MGRGECGAGGAGRRVISDGGGEVAWGAILGAGFIVSPVSCGQVIEKFGGGL